MKNPMKLAQTKAGKAYYFLSLSRFGDWPTTLRVGPGHLRLFIACDSRRLRPTNVRDFASVAIQQGVVDLSVWGPNCCKGFHVPFVEALPNSNDDNSNLIIANCTRDSLPESIAFFITWGRASREYRRTCKSLLFVSIGNPAWAKTIQRSLRTFAKTLTDAWLI